MPHQRPSKAGRPRVPRVFRNSYTRAGRRFLTEGWVVKVQHAGRRRTFSLRARAKSGAAREARALVETLRLGGWGAVPGRTEDWATFGERLPERQPDYWRERLVVRPYHPGVAAGRSDDWSAFIEYDGVGHWFPLGTAVVAVAAERAAEIFRVAMTRGWAECGRLFARELILGFEWQANPVLWTYATIHTLVYEPSRDAAEAGEMMAEFRVLVVEEDPGVARALAVLLNRQPGVVSAVDSAVDGLVPRIAETRPQLVLLNRSLADRVGMRTPGQLMMLAGTVPVVTYSVAVDGDRLFGSTPGGAQGYLIKRVASDRLLSPIWREGLLPGGTAEDWLSRVRDYFREMIFRSPDRAPAGWDQLTRRERQVLALLGKGRVDKEIAQALGISTWTVRGYVKSIFERLQVRTRTEAAIRYLEK